jgi:hypothetical protein
VLIDGGRTPAGLDAVDWARRGVALGAGEILLTSMDRDGTLAGYDLELTRAVVSAVSVPLIASGGAGRPEHFAEVLTLAGADAALGVKSASEMLIRLGIPLNLRAWGIANSPDKNTALRSAQAEIISNVNTAIQEALTQIFLEK